MDSRPRGSAKGSLPHSNGSDFTADGFFGPSVDARRMNAPTSAPASTKVITMPTYSLISKHPGFRNGQIPTLSTYGCADDHTANVPGKTPPTIVTNAASTTAAETAGGKRAGADSCVSVMNM